MLPQIVSAADYRDENIKDYISNVPRNKEKNINILADYLARPYKDDYDKAKSIAYWIASHINYDRYLYNNGKTTKLFSYYQGQQPKDLLKSRVGICGDFSELFVSLCKSAGIKAYMVYGYAYPSNKSLTTKILQNSGHAWNYFVYKNKKIYVDTTFMAKGATHISGRATNMNHRRALREVRLENRTSSQINEFDSFYFDFSYSQEAKKRGYQHYER